MIGRSGQYWRPTAGVRGKLRRNGAVSRKALAHPPRSTLYPSPPPSIWICSPPATEEEVVESRMGKRLRKCRGMAELAEATQRAAARLGLAEAGGHRSSKRRKTAGEQAVCCLELRSRSVVLKPRIARSAGNSAGRRRSCPEVGRISRCSSDASCEAASPSSELGHECDTASLSRCKGERGATTASSNRGEGASDLESTVETEPRRRSTAAAIPSVAELEDFFAAAEDDLRRKFTERYNFDIVTDAPLAGHYEWIPLTP